MPPMPPPLPQPNGSQLPASPGSPVTMFAYDSDTKLRWVKNAPASLGESEFMELLEHALIHGVSRRTFSSAVEQVSRTGVPFFGDCTLELDGALRSFEISLNAHINDRVLGVAIDLAERAPTQRAVQSLSLELAHRTKNLMAVISSLATQTGRRAETISDFVVKFTGQIGSLSRAHDSIAATGWRGAALDEVIKSQVISVIPHAAVECSADQAAILLTPNAAQNIAMVLHELATSCVTNGSVAVCISRDENDNLILSWICNADEQCTRLWTDLLTKVAPLTLGGLGQVTQHDEVFRYDLAVAPEHFSTI